MVNPEFMRKEDMDMEKNKEMWLVIKTEQRVTVTKE